MITTPDKLIIHRVHCQSVGSRSFSLLISTGYWGVLTYMLKGLVILTGWGTAWGLSDFIISRTPAETVLHTSVLTYLTPALSLTSALWSWALYNWLRFRGKRDKRREKQSRLLSLKDISKAWMISEADLIRIREAKVGICHFDGNGRVCGIECGENQGKVEATSRRHAAHGTRSVQLPVAIGFGTHSSSQSGLKPFPHKTGTAVANIDTYCTLRIFHIIPHNFSENATSYVWRLKRSPHVASNARLGGEQIRSHDGIA